MDIEHRTKKPKSESAKFAPLIAETNELISIFVASIRTTKANRKG